MGCRKDTKILGSATEGGSTIVLGDKPFLRDTEIGHADVALGCQQDILGLEIPMVEIRRGS